MTVIPSGLTLVFVLAAVLILTFGAAVAFAGQSLALVGLFAVLGGAVSAIVLWRAQSWGGTLAAILAENKRHSTAINRYAEHERLYLAAIESSTSAFLTAALDGTITAWNPGAERMFGFSANEAIGQNVRIIAPAERRDEVDANLERIRRSERVGALETLRMDKSGRPIDVVLNISPIKDSSGTPIGESVFVYDASEQRRAKELFRLAVEASPSGMVMVDGGGRIIMVNGELERLFGYDRSELIGQSVDMLVPVARREAHQFALREFVDHPRVRRLDGSRNLSGLRKDGREFMVEIGLNPISIGERLLVLGSVVDISERARGEHIKDAFVSTVSHELRTPLTSIAGSLSLLAGGAAGALPAPALRLLTIAHNNSERLIRLINDILDIEKIESGRVTFDFKRLDARALVEQAIEANRGFAEQFSVRVLLDKDAPAIDVRADPDRLMQVVTNLLSNAIKFSPPLSEVAIAIEPHEDMVRISVRDHGPGIPVNFRPRMFEKFAQADTTDARQKGGTGLGLSIVKQVVLRLGGKVGFEDAPDGGTIFFFTVPRWQADDDIAEDDRTSDSSHLLLCEDDNGASRALSEHLTRAGFAVEIARTASEAAGLAAKRAYGAILVNLQLPDSDGISLIQRLRVLPRHLDTPIIVICGEPDHERKNVGLANLNVLDWLQKPVDVVRLTHILDWPIVRKTTIRPRILHVADDAVVLGLVAQALDATADVVSADSIEAAHRALQSHHFDFVVLDIATAAGSGVELLPDLRDSEGDPIPVVVISEQGKNRDSAERVQQALSKSKASIDRLVAVLNKWHGRARPAAAQKEVA